MQKKVVNIGDKIELTHVKSATRGKLSENTYASMLLDFEDNRILKISMPIREGKVVPLEIGDEYELCFFTSSGLYRSRGRITRRYRDGKLFVMNVELLFSPKKFQRRQFFRLECMMKVRYRIVTDEEKTLRDFIHASDIEDNELRKKYLRKLDEMTTNWEEVMMTDISGGGVRLQLKKRIENKTLIEVVVPLRFSDETIPFKCFARVIANVKTENVINGNELRCQFENISRVQQEMVVRFVFEEQKRRMRKE